MSCNVLYVANSSLASPTGGGRTRILSAARSVNHKNISVILLCFFPPHQGLTERTFLTKGREKLARESGCQVIYAPRLTLRRYQTINRLNEWWCGIIIAIICMFLKISIVHGQATTPSIYALRARTFLPSIKIVADIHGLRSEEYLYEKSGHTNNTFVKIYESYDNTAITKSDWIIFVSHAMQRYYTYKLVREINNSSIVPCATDTFIKLNKKKRKQSRVDNKIDGKIVFCYIGSLESYQLPDRMCELFNQILDHYPEAFWLIISHHEEAFLRYLNSAKIDPNSYRIISVEHKEVFDVLPMCDIGFILRDDSLLNRVASPVKFAEYGLCGLPVITTEFVGDISDMVKSNHLGIAINLDNPKMDTELASFIDEVRTNRDEYAIRCSSFIKDNFSWSEYGEVLNDIYNELSCIKAQGQN